MHLLPFAVAGSLLALGCTLDRQRRRVADGAPRRNEAETENLETQIQDEALARAMSEVKSGEIDMLG